MGRSSSVSVTLNFQNVIILSEKLNRQFSECRMTAIDIKMFSTKDQCIIQGPDNGPTAEHRETSSLQLRYYTYNFTTSPL